MGDVLDYFDDVISEVSHKWDDLARKLGFSENQIKGIESLKPDQDRRCREVLHRWRNREGREATLQVLQQALIEIDGRMTAESLQGDSPRWSAGMQKRKRGAEPTKETDVGRKAITLDVAEYFFFIKKKVSTNWKDLADCLRLDWAEVRNIDGRNPDDESRCRDMLDVWQTRRGDAATVDVLMEALCKAQLQSVVDDIKDEYPELR